MATKLKPLDELSALPATDIKKSWRDVVRKVDTEGTIVVTNHQEPQAVVLAPEVYARMVEAMNQVEAAEERKLAALRQQFDERLASLRAPDAGERIRSFMKSPAKLDGKLKAGERH